jgi:hypothetical protein
LIADLTTWSLAIHGPVCAFAWLAIMKLGGESKFATEHLKELCELRPKLLRSVSSSLAETLRPVLTLANSVESPRVFLLDGDSRPVAPVPSFTPIGEERLRDAVRDFVKSDISGMKDLRALDRADGCLRVHLKRLRVGVWFIAVLCGVFTLVAVLAKSEIFKLQEAWPHFAAFGIVIAVLVVMAYFVLRVLLAINRGDDLRKAYGDL